MIDFCSIIRSTLKSLYQGTWEVEYELSSDSYIVQKPGGGSRILEGKKNKV